MTPLRRPVMVPRFMVVNIVVRTPNTTGNFWLRAMMQEQSEPMHPAFSQGVRLMGIGGRMFGTDGFCGGKRDRRRARTSSRVNVTGGEPVSPLVGPPPKMRRLPGLDVGGMLATGGLG